MNVLCVIPARSGSKRVPKKNIRSILGKPLIQYTIDAALGDCAISKVVVSTNDSDVEEIALSRGAGVVKRPEELCQDSSPIDHAVRHAIQECEKNDNVSYDVVVLLQANVPVRKQGEIDAAVNMLVGDSLATAVATAYEIDQRPEWMKVHDEETGFAKPFMAPTESYRMQDLQKMYLLDGAIIVLRKEVLSETVNDRTVHAYMGSHVKLLVHGKQFAVEIDEEDDFAVAEFYLGNKA